MLPADAWEYADSLREPEVREWQGWDDTTIETMTLQYSMIMQLRFRGHPTHLAIRNRDNTHWLGQFSVAPDQADPLGDTVFLGWWLAAHARGKGLAHESLAMVLQWLHDEVGVGSVRIGTRSDNERALRMIARSGARFVEERPTPLPNSTTPMGKWFVHEV